MRLASALLPVFLLIAPQAFAAKTAPRAPAKNRVIPETAGDYMQLADFALDAENFDAAEHIAREGQAKFPHAVGFHLLLGDILAAHQKKAAAFYEYQWELMRVGPERPSGLEAQEKAGALLEEGRGTDTDELHMIVDAVTKMEGEPAASAATLKRYVDRRDAFVLEVLLAEALVKAEKRNDAVPIYRELIKRDPYFVPAYVDLAEILQKSGKADESKALISKAKDIDADHWRLKTLTE